MSEQEKKCVQERDIRELRDLVIDLRSDVRVMARDEEEMLAKIKRLKDKYDLLNELATSNRLMKLTLEQITEHNSRQDDLQERRATIMDNQNETLININQNLKELSTGLNNVNMKVEKLETRVEAGEERNKIDLRDVNKDNMVTYMKKNIVPFGIGAALLAILLEIIKVWK